MSLVLKLLLEVITPRATFSTLISQVWAKGLVLQESMMNCSISCLSVSAISILPENSSETFAQNFNINISQAQDCRLKNTSCQQLLKRCQFLKARESGKRPGRNKKPRGTATRLFRWGPRNIPAVNGSSHIPACPGQSFPHGPGKSSSPIRASSSGNNPGPSLLPDPWRCSWPAGRSAGVPPR